LVGYYNPLSVQIFRFEAFYWANDETQVPSDMRLWSGDCPWPDEEIEFSQTGYEIAVAACVVIFLIVAVMTAIIWKRWWNLSVPPLSDRREIG
jgi:hypothetical protein